MSAEEKDVSAGFHENKPLPDDVTREILQRLAAESDEDIDADALLPTMSLREDLGMDSMQAVSLSLDLEDAFSIRLEDGDLVKLETVGDLLAVVQSKLAQRG